MGGRGGSSGLAKSKGNLEEERRKLRERLAQKNYEPDVSKMTGSEKQIEWAKDLIKRARYIMNDFEEERKDDPRMGRLREAHKAVISNMEKQQARYIIEYFKNVNDYRSLAYAMRDFEDELRIRLRKK